MCGRFVLHTPTSEIARLVGLGRDNVGGLRPRYNISPSLAILNVQERLDSRGLETYWWGFTPHWAPANWNGPRPINARADKLSSGMYRSALRATPGGPQSSLAAGRSLIFADGFFEPDKISAKKPPYPQHFFYPRDGVPLALAGLFAHWRQAPDDSLYLSCAIITTEPNATVGAIHPRMPAILPPAHWDAWLDPAYHDAEALVALLGPASETLLDRYQVDERRLSRRDSDGRWYDDPSVIAPKAME